MSALYILTMTAKHLAYVVMKAVVKFRMIVSAIDAFTDQELW